MPEGNVLLKKGDFDHHDWCPECCHVSKDNTPEDFPLPGEIAEEICVETLKPHKLHRAIAEAIAERDRLWAEREAKQSKEETASPDGEKPEGLFRAIPPGMFGKPIC